VAAFLPTGTPGQRVNEIVDGAAETLLRYSMS